MDISGNQEKNCVCKSILEKIGEHSRYVNALSLRMTYVYNLAAKLKIYS